MEDNNPNFKVTVDAQVDLTQYLSGPFGDAETEEEAEKMAEELISKKSLIVNLKSGVHGITEDDITYTEFNAEKK